MPRWGGAAFPNQNLRRFQTSTWLLVRGLPSYTVVWTRHMSRAKDGAQSLLGKIEQPPCESWSSGRRWSGTPAEVQRSIGSEGYDQGGIIGLHPLQGHRQIIKTVHLQHGWGRPDICVEVPLALFSTQEKSPQDKIHWRQNPHRTYSPHLGQHLPESQELSCYPGSCLNTGCRVWVADWLRASSALGWWTPRRSRSHAVATRVWYLRRCMRCVQRGAKIWRQFLRFWGERWCWLMYSMEIKSNCMSWGNFVLWGIVSWIRSTTATWQTRNVEYYKNVQSSLAKVFSPGESRLCMAFYLRTSFGKIPHIMNKGLRSWLCWIMHSGKNYLYIYNTQDYYQRCRSQLMSEPDNLTSNMTCFLCIYSVSILVWFLFRFMMYDSGTGIAHETVRTYFQCGRWYWVFIYNSSSTIHRGEVQKDGTEIHRGWSLPEYITSSEGL